MLDEDFTVLVRSGLLRVATVDFLNQEGHAGHGCPSQGVLLDDSQAGLRGVLEGQLTAGPGVQDDALAVVGVQDIRGRHRQLCDFVGACRQAGQSVGAVCTSRNGVLVADIDAANLESRVRHRLTSGCINLLDGQLRTLVVLGGNNDGLLALNVCLVNIGANRLRHLGISIGSICLDEVVETFSHIGNCNSALSVRGFGANQLAILVDVENGTFQRIVALVNFLELNFDLGIVLEHKLDVTLAVPVELLNPLIRVRTYLVAFRCADFFGNIRADGEVRDVKISFADITACASYDPSRSISNADAANLNDCTSQADCGIVRIDFSDAAATSDFWLIVVGKFNIGILAIINFNILR